MYKMRFFGRALRADPKADLTMLHVNTCPQLSQHAPCVTSHVQISAANYEARAFGIRADMSIGEGKRLCPHLLVVPYMFDAFQVISEKVGSAQNGSRSVFARCGAQDHLGKGTRRLWSAQTLPCPGSGPSVVHKETAYAGWLTHAPH